MPWVGFRCGCCCQWPESLGRYAPGGVPRVLIATKPCQARRLPHCLNSNARSPKPRRAPLVCKLQSSEPTATGSRRRPTGTQLKPALHTLHSTSQPRLTPPRRMEAASSVRSLVKERSAYLYSFSLAADDDYDDDNYCDTVILCYPDHLSFSHSRQFCISSLQPRVEGRVSLALSCCFSL
jgi:hypothetical protein